ncbi:MAG: T9SS type A sorting domain-containing protein, partial [candidate division WOR-3 bacterium]
GIGEKKEELSETNTFSVLPRVFRNSLIITTNRCQWINLFDISGRRVMGRNLMPGRTVWNLSPLPAGVYLVRASGGEDRRLVKVK